MRQFNKKFLLSWVSMRNKNEKFDYVSEHEKETKI